MKKVDDRAKKILYLFLGIIVFILFICVIAFVIGKAKNSSLTYSEIEEKMVAAAKEYYSQRATELPLNESERNVEVSVSSLVSAGLMKEISSYQKDGIVCDGKVKVTKSIDYYDYSPYLDCGDNYRTVYLYEKLLDGIVSENDGLYKTTQFSKDKGNVTRYIFRGEYPNNYVLFSNVLWRIVKINEDNTITLIHSKVNSKDFDSIVWDNRYNINTDAYDGINNFDESRVKRNLQIYYNKVFTDRAKTKLARMNTCVGSRLNADNKNDGSIECSKLANESLVSLLPAYDFINSSLDKNCKTIIDKSCSNYNYLTKYSATWWTLTTNKNYPTTAYVISSFGSRKDLNASAYARMVVALNENTIYLRGTGTSNNPYVIK